MAHGLEPGSQLGHYEIVSNLGEGGMGQVYLARDTRLERMVALKTLPPELRTNADRQRRFLQEARIASALSHPNICYMHEIGESRGISWIAMEYIEGESLAKKIADGPLPVDEILSISSQVAEALEAAHARGIVHRDIKPSNIIVSPRGHVKVLDFGLAKMSAEESDETQLLTRVGTLLGTVQYMSPEQALGRGVDARSDIFSLGSVMYEMAAGRLPFAGATSQETIARVIGEQPEAIARFNYSVPPELDRVIRKCLEKDRERRYQTARELAIDLANLKRDRSSSSGSGGSIVGEPAAKTIRAVIVDDEDLARQILHEYANSSPDVEIVAECSNGFEAVKTISERKPDLIFLDVQMPKLTGFEVLELIDRDIAVVFVTAYDQYAMKAFETAAVDYLLKPVSLERFQMALERVRQRLGTVRPPAEELTAAARPPQQHSQRIVVKDGARVHVIPIAQLDYAEAQDDYVELHSKGKSYLKQQTISSLEGSLDPQQFIRVHRSFVVNLERVTRIEPYTRDSRMAILTDGTQVPVSRAGYERLKALLEDRR
jgi:two-component system LytT family response regulator